MQQMKKILRHLTRIFMKHLKDMILLTVLEQLCL